MFVAILVQLAVIIVAGIPLIARCGLTGVGYTMALAYCATAIVQWHTFLRHAEFESSPCARGHVREPSPSGRAQFTGPSPSGREQFTEPSPSGRGQGEGALFAATGATPPAEQETACEIAALSPAS
jgi:hypothetical protein